MYIEQRAEAKPRTFSRRQFLGAGTAVGLSMFMEACAPAPSTITILPRPRPNILPDSLTEQQEAERQKYLDKTVRLLGKVLNPSLFRQETRLIDNGPWVNAVQRSPEKTEAIFDLALLRPPYKVPYGPLGLNMADDPGDINLEVNTIYGAGQEDTDPLGYSVFLLGSVRLDKYPELKEFIRLRPGYRYPSIDPNKRAAFAQAVFNLPSDLHYRTVTITDIHSFPPFNKTNRLVGMVVRPDGRRISVTVSDDEGVILEEKDKSTWQKDDAKNILYRWWNFYPYTLASFETIALTVNENDRRLTWQFTDHDSVPGFTFTPDKNITITLINNYGANFSLLTSHIEGRVDPKHLYKVFDRVTWNNRRDFSHELNPDRSVHLLSNYKRLPDEEKCDLTVKEDGTFTVDVTQPDAAN